MAGSVGLVFNNANSKRTIQVIAGAAGAVAVPTLATDGVPNYPVESVYGSDTGACYGTMSAKNSSVAIRTVGGTTPSFKANIWGYLAGGQGNNIGTWFLVKALNAGAAIAAAGGGQTQYSEVVTNLGHWDRLAIEINTVTGTLASLDAYITTDRGDST